MLTVPTTRYKMGVIIVMVGSTLAIWLASEWHNKDWFVTPCKFVAQAASLSATVLMCWHLGLSTAGALGSAFSGDWTRSARSINVSAAGPFI